MSDDERRFEELQNALAIRHEMLEVVAHDLRGPLNILTMGLEILRHSAPPGQESNIERMRRAIDSMSDLVTNLIDLSHIREGRQVLNVATIYPDVLLRDVFLMQQPLVARRGLGLEHEAARNLPPVSADYERLLRVFADLVNHSARKALPGSTIRIEADAWTNGDVPAVSFLVTHEGTPIRQDELGLDVDTYFRLGTPERKIADLGLAIARAVIEAHGGRVVPCRHPTGEPSIRFWLPGA
ncbi:MAG TPA: HAMP domain-containing sensor histidine kinase [Candidatus Eisenbacteria bacterium]